MVDMQNLEFMNSTLFPEQDTLTGRLIVYPTYSLPTYSSTHVREEDLFIKTHASHPQSEFSGSLSPCRML